MSETRKSIESALKDFATRPLREAATALLSTLGYESSRVLQFDSLEELPKTVSLEEIKGGVKSFCGLFQLTSDEVRSGGQTKLFNAGRFENTIVESYVFVALELNKTEHTRTELAKITRALNKSFSIPVFVIFKHGNTISLSVTRRRLNKRDEGKDVLEKVTIIKDIAQNPHRAHLDILEDLHLPSLLAGKVITEFVQLEQMWAKVLDIEELNKKFYKELSGWFYWAFDHANISFPNEKTAKTDKERGEIRQINLIRLITRLIFTWFLKEKNLVPEELFEDKKLPGILKDFDKLEGTNSNYYQSILQNLFFATLNTEMGKDDKGTNHRRFKDDTQTRNNAGYMVHNLYRYQGSFTDPSQAVQLFGSVPFLNGGLFECLDREKNTETFEKELRIDGFSDKLEKRAVVPNALFFAENQNADLSKHLGTKFKNAKVRGILEILNGYKFTVTENTPIEEEVALDPELLGKVFENLLAAYNPETEETARKQTGSFYTPRDVVDFMVDESLIAYLHHALTGGQATMPEGAFYGQEVVVNGVNAGEQAPMLMPENDPNHLLTPNVQAGDKDPLEERLRRLFSYSTEYKSEFSSEQKSELIHAIDTAKILDPACGSGAFPMGVLQKLVFVLGRLDTGNQLLLTQQRAKLEAEIKADPEIKTIRADLETIRNIKLESIKNVAEQEATRKLRERLREIERPFDTSITYPDYVRKLVLIENCIYGVDIQPIAVQIAKLRCFISLVIDQKVDDNKDNRGILPLPNLETKFVAANSLMPLGDQMPLLPPEVSELENQLEIIRSEHFRAKNFRSKKALRNKDAQTRQAIAKLLEGSGYAKASAQRMAAFDPYNQNSSAPFFDPHWMFGNTGFDVVIGNPPYVRHEKIKDQKPALLQAYGKGFFSGTSDLYVYFFKRGLEVLNAGGVLSYICSNKYFRSGYGENLRKHLLEKTRLRQIIDFGDAPVFTAIAYPSILVAQNQKPNKQDTMRVLSWNQADDINNFREIVETQSFTMPQSSLKLDSWRIERGDVLQLLEKLKAAGTPLGEYVGGRFYYGIKTGFNEAFVVDKTTRDDLIKQHPSSKEILKPFLRGRDVKRWKVNNPELWLLFIPWHFPLHNDPSIVGASEKAEKAFQKQYPAIYKHLLKFKSELENRNQAETGIYYEWYALQRAAATYWKEFETTKIIYPDIYAHQSFAWDTEKFYSTNTNYFIPTTEKWLTGLLNSRPVEWFYGLTSNSIQGGFLRAFSDYMKLIPIPKPSSTTEKIITNLVNGILLLTSLGNQHADMVAYLEQLIDALVYELYLPDILHAANRHPEKIIEVDPPPEHPTLENLQTYYARVYDPKHEIRKLVFYLNEIAEVKIIGGKGLRATPRLA